MLETNPTAENIARLIYDTAKAKKLPVSSVTLWETPNSFATYCERPSGKPRKQTQSRKGDERKADPLLQLVGGMTAAIK